MGRHVGSHTYGNTACAVHQEVREAARQYDRLTQRIVEVELHVYGILVNITQHFLSQLRETRLGITHSGCAVTVHRTEVTLAVHQAITHVPRLGHTHQRTVD